MGTAPLLPAVLAPVHGRLAEGGGPEAPARL